MRRKWTSCTRVFLRILPTPIASSLMPADYDPRLSNTPPSQISAHVLKFYRLSRLNAALANQGRALISQALIAARDCDGT